MNKLEQSTLDHWSTIEADLTEKVKNIVGVETGTLQIPYSSPSGATNYAVWSAAEERFTEIRHIELDVKNVTRNTIKL
jgi:hypothetical protein